MSKSAETVPKESLFLWSSGGIKHVRKRVKEILGKGTGGALPPGALPADKRQYPRLDLRVPILYRIMGEGASEIPSAVRPFLLAKSTNISPIGLCLSLAEDLPKDAVVALSIHLMNQREKFTAVGRVVWTRPADQHGQFLTGLQFVVVDKNVVKEEEHARMENFVRHLQA